MQACLPASQGGSSGSTRYDRVAVVPGDWGYRIDTARSGIDRVAVDISFQGASGFYSAQVKRTNG